MPGMQKPSFISICCVFLRYANLTFGGGSATIAELEREIIDRKRWITHDQSRFAYALSRITPGTNLLAYCTAVGWLMRGPLGAVMALVGAAVPVAVLAVIVTALYESWSHNAMAGAALHGALVAAVAVTAATGWVLIRPYKGSVAWLKIGIGAVGSLALSLAGVTPLWVLLIAAAAGALWPAGKPKP